MRFFIIGTGRSGTTLLQKMMTRHPDTFVFPETHWIPKLAEVFGRQAVPVENLLDIVERTTHVTGKPTTAMDRGRFVARVGAGREMTVRAFCDEIGRMFAEDAGKRFWADKTPDYNGQMTLLQQLWPETRFIHILREGTKVADSMMRHPGFQVMAALNEISWCPISYNGYHQQAQRRETGPADFTTLWHDRLKRTLDEASRLAPERYLEIRFEDLVADPHRILAQLAVYCHLSVDPTWLTEASALIDPRRQKRIPSPAIVETFGARENALLERVGYSPTRQGEC